MYTCKPFPFLLLFFLSSLQPFLCLMSPLPRKLETSFLITVFMTVAIIIGTCPSAAAAIFLRCSLWRCGAQAESPVSLCRLLRRALCHSSPGMYWRLSFSVDLLLIWLLKSAGLAFLSVNMVLCVLAVRALGRLPIATDPYGVRVWVSVTAPLMSACGSLWRLCWNAAGVVL